MMRACVASSALMRLKISLFFGFFSSCARRAYTAASVVSLRSCEIRIAFACALSFIVSSFILFKSLIEELLIN